MNVSKRWSLKNFSVTDERLKSFICLKMIARSPLPKADPTVGPWGGRPEDFRGADFGARSPGKTNSGADAPQHEDEGCNI